MKEKIIQFVSRQKVASICCVDEACNPYSFSSFFAFNEKEFLLYFKSSAETKHAKLLLKKPQVSGTILPDKLNPLLIKGIQFTGQVLNEVDPLCYDAAALYYLKFPFAMAIPGEVWTIQLLNIKMTDNSLGFGKKLLWERYEKEAMHAY